MEKRYSLHRDGSLRAPWWDYQSTGAYFITLCTENRKTHFGHIYNKKMCLSLEGAMAYEIWEDLPNHFSYVHTGEFIVMPDHVHGIICIKRDYKISKVQMPYPDLRFDNKINLEDKYQMDTLEDDPLTIANEKSKRAQWMSHIAPKRGSLGSIIRSYKSAVSKNCRSINPNFSWQPLYYEHIIRDEIEFYKISKYIRYNPERWEKE